MEIYNLNPDKAEPQGFPQELIDQEREVGLTAVNVNERRNRRFQTVVACYQSWCGRCSRRTRPEILICCIIAINISS